MQGITDARFRRQHYTTYGGVAEYYTPFARVERGRIRDKEKKDLLPERNQGVPTVPQVIARDRSEFATLCDSLQRMGWGRIDINMGCPFPLQATAGRGSGILPHVERIEGILQEVALRTDVAFSIKMRLGWDDPMQCFEILPMINQSPIMQVTLHPRLGVQQYEGTVDMDACSLFYDGCEKPLVYNGDIHSVADIRRVVKAFPRLHAVMIGRGLVENPTLARDYSMDQR